MLPVRAVVCVELALVVGLAAACEKRGGSKPAPVASARVEAPVSAPEPPRTGHATLTFRGAFTKVIDVDTTACVDATFRIGSEELGEATGPAWDFYIFEQTPGTWLATFSLGGADDGAPADDTVTDTAGGERQTYTWKGKEGSPQLVRSSTSATIALSLAGPGGAQVDVAGELRCPSYSSAPVPQAITSLLARHTGASVRPYSTYDFGRARYAGAASAIIVGGDARAESTLRALRRDLPPGWVAYLGTSSFFGDEKVAAGAVELVVAPGRTPLDILRNARTDAVNYGLLTEALVRKLAAWDRAWGIDILRAETDTIELELRRLPDDLAAFAKEVHAFCPDVVDQGTGTIAALESEIATRRRVHLWWD